MGVALLRCFNSPFVFYFDGALVVYSDGTNFFLNQLLLFQWEYVNSLLLT